MERIMPSSGRQRGAILIVSLLILLVMTVIGIAGMNTVTLEEKMASNARDQNLAFQSAETALRVGEAFIESQISTASFDNSDGLYAKGSAPNVLNSATWSPEGTGSVAVPGLEDVAQPRYFIEYIGELPKPQGAKINIGGYGQTAVSNIQGFRIIAKGTGRSGSAQVILESRYGKQF